MIKLCSFFPASIASLSSACKASIDSGFDSRDEISWVRVWGTWATAGYCWNLVKREAAVMEKTMARAVSLRLWVMGLGEVEEEAVILNTSRGVDGEAIGDNLGEGKDRRLLARAKSIDFADWFGGVFEWVEERERGGGGEEC